MKTTTCTTHKYYIKQKAILAGSVELLRFCKKCGDSKSYNIIGAWDFRSAYKLYRKHYCEVEGANRERDFQRSKLYSWERIAVWSKYPNVASSGASDPMTMIHTKTFVNKIFKDFGIPTPTFYWGKGRTASWNPDSKRLNFPMWARCTPIIIHECAHAVCDFLYGSEKSAHGGEYVEVYIHLLSKYGGLDSTELTRNAKMYGLRVNNTLKLKTKVG